MLPRALPSSVVAASNAAFLDSLPLLCSQECFDVFLHVVPVPGRMRCGHYNSIIVIPSTIIVIPGINAKKSWFLSRAKIDIPLQIGIPMGPYEPAVLPILVFESGEISL